MAMAFYRRPACGRRNIMSFFSWLRNRTSLRCPQGRPQHRPAAPRFRPHLEPLEDRWLPSTLTVTNNLDSGTGSLRYEIAAAKNNDTIVFAPSLAGQTIELTTGQLNVNKSVTIQGPGAGELTVSGGYRSRVFYVWQASKVSLSGLTISNGVTIDGGGILNRGTLTVSGCTLYNNSAYFGGGIYNDSHGTLTVSGCTLTGNWDGQGPGAGGGIYNAGKLTVSNSAFSNAPDNIYGSYTDGGGNTFG
jgi:hypothetical protein